MCVVTWDLASAHIDVASSGGTINLEGAEALQVAGALSGKAGAGGSISGAAAMGGTLNLILNGDLTNSGGRVSGAYPTNPRVLTVTVGDETQMVDEGGAIPDTLNGVGTVSTATIQSVASIRLVLPQGHCWSPLAVPAIRSRRGRWPSSRASTCILSRR
jgi:hypothetical protein